ncbi:MAG: sodium:proton antiporter [Tardiphaga sp.]|uniref:cation:proton antiporter n=1 Tax=Tardiphaga sp. TaxID=1926292 RepID=UPI0019971180|nr:sodium:proton antiporter [Tardiphaga sp.]MBC7586258.1 sodium:proton antiporter [Tardiphaga sp.]
MTAIDVIFIVLGLTLVTALLAPHLPIPAPVVFAAVGIGAGMAWHLVPVLPVIHMPPDLVLFVFLPPLLTTAAYALPLQAFRRNLLPIGLLAIGLVLATAGIAAVIGHAFAGLGWGPASVPGATLAPPDPVAATAVAGKTGLSHRLVVTLEGEGLVNDAVAIVAYGIALTALTTGQFDATDALLAVLQEAPIGVAVGLAAGWTAGQLRRHIETVPLEIGISLATPYLAYHFAERLGGSAVLAVVTLGLMLRSSAARVSSPVARLASRTVWSFLRFVSTALVFLLLGLLIGQIAVDLPDREVLRAGAVLSAGIIGVRMAWMLVVPRLVALLGASGPTPSLGEQVVLGWAGMRGVVSLALALALPLSLGGDGHVRQTIIFLTLIAIVVTLLVQGATLLPLVNLLKVGNPERERREERAARLRARRAGMAAAKASGAPVSPVSSEGDELVARLESGRIGIARPGALGGRGEHRSALLRALTAQRNVVDELRDAGRMSGVLAERLDTELDLDAMNAAGEGARLTDGGEA